jgi:hypothetical protein
MATLMFECPANGAPVSTRVEVDATSFYSLSPHTTYLSCPHCPAPHLLGDVRAWLSEKIDTLLEVPPDTTGGIAS